MRIHDRQPRRRTEAYRNAILPTHTEWTTMAVGRPLGYPYEPHCGVHHQSTTLYAAVLMHQSTTLFAAVLMRQSATLIAAVLRRQSTNYAAVFATKALRTMLRCLHTNALRICCGYYTKALRNSYGGVYCISTEVLRPEVSVTAPNDAEVVTITEAGLLQVKSP